MIKVNDLNIFSSSDGEKSLHFCLSFSAIITISSIPSLRKMSHAIVRALMTYVACVDCVDSVDAIDKERQVQRQGMSWS